MRHLILPALLAASWVATASAGLSEAQQQRLRRILADGVANGDVAGGALLLIHRGEVVFREGFGWADVARKRRFTPELRCKLASMTKSTTATVLLLLEQQGKLSLDDRIDRHLPAFAGAKLGVPTIRQCLSHTSGLPGQDRRDTVDADSGGTLAGVVANIARLGLEAAPGTRYEYSRLGFDVAARIAEIVSGSDYAALARRLLFDPLGMRDTGFRPDQPTRDGMPTQYTRKHGALVGSWWVMKPTPPGGYVSAGGGLTSTLDDMAKFFRLHASGGLHGETSIVDEARLKAMYVAQPATDRQYGLGFKVDTTRRRVQHGGASGTLGWVDFDQQLIGVVLTQTASRDNRDFPRRVQRAVDELIAPGSTAAELAEARQLLARWDRDGDGKVARDELPPRLRDAFDKIDRDASGAIELEELATALERRARARAGKR